MNSVYSTGNPIVDENAGLSISGNIIPQIWYKTIVRDSGKPYLTAIVILSDIVYWYKPVEIRDENTGQMIAMRKRFKADLLQRNYQQLADEFGVSKKEATNAVVFLEKLGVIKRVFRTINMNGIVINNVLYIELIVVRLKELTFYDRTEKVAPVTSVGEREVPEHLESSGGIPVSAKGDRVCNKEGRPPTFKVKGVALEKGVPISAQSDRVCNYGETPVPLKRGRVPTEKEIAVLPEVERYLSKGDTPVTFNGDTNTEITTETITGDYSILSYQQIREEFKERIGYDAICCDRPYEIGQLDELVEVAVDVLTTTKKEIRINKEDKPAAVVRSVYWKLNMFTIKFVMDSLKESATKVHLGLVGLMYI